MKHNNFYCAWITESARRADWATEDALLKETVHVLIVIIANVYMEYSDRMIEALLFQHREKQQQVLVYLPLIACE